MGLTISSNALKSRSVRKNIAGNNGIRQLDLGQTIAETSETNAILGWIKARWQQATSWLWNKAAGIFAGIGRWTLSTGVQWLFGTAEFLWTFDWNSSDKELESQIQSYNVQMAAIWGGFLGRGFGYLAAIPLGIGVSMLMPVVDKKAIAKLVTATVVREASQDLWGEFVNALTATAGALQKQLFIRAYIGYRKAIKWLPKAALDAFYGEGAGDYLKKEWGAEGAPTVSFAQTQEDWVQSFKSPVTQAFFESFFEDAWDSFTEAGYLIAETLDDQLELQQEISKGVLGEVKAVKIAPDKKNPDEELVFYGNQNLIAPAIISTLNTHQMIHNRDIGFFEETRLVAQPAPPQKRTLRIILYSSPSPPWRRAGERLKKSEHIIPDPKPDLTWQDVKRAVGGTAGMKVGDFAATVRFSSRRQFTVYGDTKDTALANARRFAELSEAQVFRVHVSENIASRQTPRRAVTVYGAFIHVGKVIPDGTSDRQNIDGQRYREEKARYPLWLDDAPGNLRNLF